MQETCSKESINDFRGVNSWLDSWKLVLSQPTPGSIRRKCHTFLEPCDLSPLSLSNPGRFSVMPGWYPQFLLSTIGIDLAMVAACCSDRWTIAWLFHGGASLVTISHSCSGCQYFISSSRFNSYRVKWWEHVGTRTFDRYT